MKIVALAQLDDAARQRMLRRANSRIFDAQILESARRAIEDVQARGDDALLDYTRRWDGVDLTREQLIVRRDEIAAARGAVTPDLLGIDRIFRCNGVAGIAAFAVGTDTIPAVPAIVGPGNPYIVATQLMAQTLGVRMLAMLGPTEAMVLADGDADPRRLALDLLNEAEHGQDSAAILVTDSRTLAADVARVLP